MKLYRSRPNIPALLVASVASLLIAGLAAGGPFFDVMRGAATRPVTLSFVPGDGQIATSVGRLDSGAHAFASTNAAGALVYGPYITLHPGHYVVSWTGTAGATIRPQFEVFSTQHGTVASSTMPVTPSAASALLNRLEFDVPTTLNGIELRVLVERGDELSVDGVTLQIEATGKGGRHE